MKTLLMIMLLAATSHAYAEQPGDPMSPEHEQAAEDGEHSQTPHMRTKRSVGSSAGLPCEPGHKLVGDECEEIAEFE
ncbi:hypothetical protein KSS93_14905 [Pseudomonas xanthosomatis]|uniref:hypothetical protein n=1 Tax=Pseudomonas xanthosomatis TaxID=2842356 RepID=UPI001C3E2759|nr:hypothetical protein [Pseudomonas xanthosomatis]QXH44187.1 hypothetical protein KSS93_14905 [Pseudomonas xanthosomatis]